MNELSCSFSHEVYSDGCVVALLKGLTPSHSSFPNLSLSIRAYGYMRLDIRWITNAGLLRRAASLPFAEYFATSSQDELKSNVYCIYKTQTLLLSYQDLENLPNGLFIQFDLPPSSALLPSFKGLHGTIAYHLIVTASHFTQHKDQSLFFPFRISGKGYSSPFFDVIEHDICRFYKTTLSLEHILSRTDDYAFLDECKAFNAAYSIRDDAHICIVTITSPVFQQDMIVLVFNFEGCEQRCDRIRVTFIMNEVKEDGSILHVIIYLSFEDRLSSFIPLAAVFSVGEASECSAAAHCARQSCVYSYSSASLGPLLLHIALFSS